MWELLHDPVALQRMVPGCQSLQAESDTRFSATLAVGVGPIRGRFSGAVEIEDVAAPESYRMTLSGQGPTGFVSGEGLITLGALALVRAWRPDLLAQPSRTEA